jgi:hypothetical protein
VRFVGGRGLTEEKGNRSRRRGGRRQRLQQRSMESGGGSKLSGDGEQREREDRQDPILSSTSPPCFPPPLSTSVTAGLWRRSVRDAAGLCRYHHMGKERAGRCRHPPLPPYGEGARGEAPTSVVGRGWRRGRRRSIRQEGPRWRCCRSWAW